MEEEEGRARGGKTRRGEEERTLCGKTEDGAVWRGVACGVGREDLANMEGREVRRGV